MGNFFIPTFIAENPRQKLRLKQALNTLEQHIRHERSTRIHITLEEEDYEVIKVISTEKTPTVFKFYCSQLEPSLDFYVCDDPKKDYQELRINNFEYKIYRKTKSKNN